MKILKYLFFLLLIVIIAGAIYIATKDGKYQVEETAIINAPVPVVYNEVNNYYNWENWGPWRKKADDVVINYHETTRGEGGGFNWRSEEVGDGSVTTTRAIPNSEIEQEVLLEPTFAESRGRMYWRFEEVEEGTRVILGMEGSQSFREKLAFTLKDYSIVEYLRPRFSEGLSNLDAQVENKMREYSVNVDGVTTHGGGFYMYSTTATRISQIPTRMQEMLTDVRNYMDANNITQQGDPFILYNDWDEQNNSAIYSVGVFTPSLVITPTDSNVLNGMMPVQKVVKTTLKGDYNNLGEAWDRTYSYIEENNLEANEASEPFEVYRVSSEATLNPARWITEIYVPLVDSIPSNNN